MTDGGLHEWNTTLHISDLFELSADLGKDQKKASPYPKFPRLSL